MSLPRLALTTATMGVVAVLLAALTPPAAELIEALTAPQRTADTAGPDALVLAVTGVLAWAVWAWGSLGLLLTALAAAPGLLGDAARLLLHGVLPAGARRGAAVLLGVGLGVTGPLVLPATGLVAPATATAAPAPAVPDWPATAAPAAAPEGVPDWPTGPDVDGSHVVVRGDCLWHIAEARLVDQLGRAPAAGETARAVQAWWAANADVIGPDPDLLLPGQVLRPPGPA